jgi:hypothetical protein
VRCGTFVMAMVNVALLISAYATQAGEVPPMSHSTKPQIVPLEYAQVAWLGVGWQPHQTLLVNRLNVLEMVFVTDSLDTVPVDMVSLAKLVIVRNVPMIVLDMESVKVCVVWLVLLKPNL